jgi:hypothetical protein
MTEKSKTKNIAVFSSKDLNNTKIYLFLWL